MPAWGRNLLHLWQSRHAADDRAGAASGLDQVGNAGAQTSEPDGCGKLATPIEGRADGSGLGFAEAEHARRSVREPGELGKHDSAGWHHDHGASNCRHEIVGQGEADAA